MHTMNTPIYVHLLIDTVASFSVNQRKINFPAPESVFKAVLTTFFFLNFENDCFF